jgi:hypothetical protein
MDFRSTSEFPTGTPRRPAGCPACQTTLPLMDFRCPTTQSQAGSYVVSGRSLHRCAPRARFGYPLRDSHFRPSRRLRVGASMGFTLQGFPFVAIGSPLRVPAFLPFPAAPAQSRRTAPTTWPTSRPRSCDESVLSPEPQVVPAADPFLGFDPPKRTPVRPGARFDRGASPLALRRFDVQTRLGLRVLQYKRVGRSVSGSPASLGFSTFRQSRCSVRRSRGRAYFFASRIPPPEGESRRSMPPTRDATTNPGLAARHRHHSACSW